MFIPDDEFEDREPPGWLIDGILPEDAEAKVVGDSGAGKTFLVTGMAFAIATGRPWLGKYKVKQGLVAYVLAEGSGRYKKRIAAWKQVEQVEGRAGVHFLPHAVQMEGRDGDQVNALLDAIKALPELPVLVIFDTQNRCMEGKDENGPRDLSNFLAAVARVREDTGATVLVVHHTGWDGGRERGHSSQRGAADTVILVEEGETEKSHVVRCLKQKDEAEFENIHLRRMTVTRDEDGETSCVLVLDTAESEGLSMKEATALRVLLDFPEGATPTQWEQATEFPNTTFRRMREALEEAGYVTTPPKKRGAIITLTDAGRGVLECLPAAARGGEKPAPNADSRVPRHTPPRGRHRKSGGYRSTLPPPGTPLRGPGAAGSAGQVSADGNTRYLARTGEQQDNAGVLRKLTKKANDKSPDYTGGIVLSGKDHRLVAWVKKTKKGRDYFSLAARHGPEQGNGAMFLSREEENGSIYRGDVILAGVTYELAGRADGDGPKSVVIAGRPGRRRVRHER